MKEFEIPFREGLRKGLRKDKSAGRNEQGLITCLNTKPAEQGLIPIVPVTYSISSTVSWPYPNLFEIADPKVLYPKYLHAVTDLLEFYVGTCSRPSLVHVKDSMYAAVFTETTDFSTYITTFEIDSAGAIAAAVTDSQQVNTDHGNYGVVKLRQDGDNAIIAVKLREASGNGSRNGEIELFAVNADGVVNATALDTLEITAAGVAITGIFRVHSGLLLVSYYDSAYKIGTFTVADDYTLTLSDTLSIQASNGDLIHVSGKTYALVGQGVGSNGFLYTFEIDYDGTLPASVIETLEFDATLADNVGIVNIKDDLYAIGYKNTDTDGQVKTVRIQADGNVGSVIDTYEWSTSANDPTICHTGGGIVCVGRTDSSNNGWMHTIKINQDTGAITDPFIDSLEYEAVQHSIGRAYYLGNHIAAVVYAGVDGDGFIKTVELTEEA